MAITYDDFIETVEEANLALVNDLHLMFLKNGCKLEIKEAKQGYVVTCIDICNNMLCFTNYVSMF